MFSVVYLICLSNNSSEKRLMITLFGNTTQPDDVTWTLYGHAQQYGCYITISCSLSDKLFEYLLLKK